MDGSFFKRKFLRHNYKQLQQEKRWKIADKTNVLHKRLRKDLGGKGTHTGNRMKARSQRKSIDKRIGWH